MFLRCCSFLFPLSLSPSLSLSLLLALFSAAPSMLQAANNDQSVPANSAVNATSEALPAWKQKYLPTDDYWRKTEQHLRLNNDTEPETLDPQLMSGVSESRIALALFEGLVTNDPHDLQIRPGVAESWEISADGLVYTFHLRNDAKWSDGKALESMDFVVSWKRVLTQATAAEYAYQLFPIKNAEAYLRGKITDFSQVGVRAVDPHTLRVTLHQSCPYFLDLCAFSTLAPVRVDVISNFGEQWTQPDHIVSNGPFVLAAWNPRQSLIVKKSPTYWDHDYVKLEQITFFPYDDIDTSYQLFLQDQLDWICAVPQTRIDEVRRNPDYYVHPYMGSYFYRFNCSKPPFDNPLVRKAFSLAVNRNPITEHITKAGQTPATWFCPAVAGYQHVAGLSYNPDAARAALAAAGYPGGKDFPVVELMFNTSEAHKQIAESICQQWQQVLGVHVRLGNTEWKDYLKNMSSLHYDIIRSSWIGDYNDPNTFFDMFVTDGGNNRTGWSDPAYDTLLKQSQAEQDHDKRFALFQKMEHMLVEQAFPIMPIYIYVYQGMLNERVLGVEQNIRDLHPYQYIWLEN